MGFKIHTDLDTYEVGNWNIYGEIYIEVEGIIFPFENWTDIVSGMLDMWLWNLLNLLKADMHGDYELHFMDGPYFIKISGDGSKIVSVSYYTNDTIKDNLIFKVNIISIIDEVLNVVEKIIKCKRFNIATRENKLNLSYEELIKLRRKI